MRVKRGQMAVNARERERLGRSPLDAHGVGGARRYDARRMKSRSLAAGFLVMSMLASAAACSGSDETHTSTAGGNGGAGGQALTCPSPIASDSLADQRQACAFTTGAKVAETLGLDAAARSAIPIKHIVVLMKENRSFDHLLGRLHDEGQPDTEAIPATFTNPDPQSAAVAPFHEATTCLDQDPTHQWLAMHAGVDGGKMDGFVKSAASSTGTDGHFAMGVYGSADLPFYYFLASTYALNDRHFASVRSGTFPNRNFLLLGTADGVLETGSGYPDPSTPTIFNALDEAGVSWGAYSDGSLFSGSLNWDLSHKGAHPFGDFIKALDDGTLPAVAFVDGLDNVEDDHPEADLQRGELWLRNVYEHAVASPLWPELALIWTYDEGGGFADHVPPPEKACIARLVPKDQLYFELGPRVPLVVVSPYARAHHVSHAVEEHTAITRFIEAVFDLPALTARDANSGALLDLFDFACAPAFLSPPNAPAAGAKGCFPSVAVTTSKPTYAPGEAVVVTFSGGPGDKAKDWIGVYAYGADGQTLPHPGSFAYDYIGGTQTPGASPVMGTVTLDASSVGAAGSWPFPAGKYTAYYLIDDGYAYAASVDFTVQ
jgi:phospholipase C